MWKKKSTNIFILDLDEIKNVKKYIYLPNKEGKLDTFKVNNYKMIKNSNNNLKTIHAFNKNEKAVITLYEDYINVFIFCDNGN